MVIVFLDHLKLSAQRVFSLKACISEAMAENTIIKKAEYSQLEGASKETEVTSKALPKVNFLANYTDNILLPVLIIPGELSGNPGTVQALEVGTNFNTGVTVSLDQALFDKSVFTAIKAARTSQQFYALNVEIAKERVLSQTAILFYQGLILERNENVLKASLKQNEKLIEITERKLSLGLVKSIDLDRLKVSKENIQVHINDLLLKKNTALNQLKVTMGLSPGIEISLAYDDNEFNSFIVPSYEADRLVEIRSLNSKQELNKLEIENFKATYYPRLALFGNYSYRGASNDAFLNKSDLSTNWFDVSSVGLRLTAPIFDGFKTKAQIQQSKYRLEKINADITQTNNQSQATYLNALAQYNLSKETLSTRLSSVNLAKNVYKINKESYNQGISDLTTLLDAETAFLQSELNYSSALFSMKIAELQLLRNSGLLLNHFNQ